MTQVAQRYGSQEYIAELLLPTAEVTFQSDEYFRYLKGAWFRDEAKLRSPGTLAATGDFPLTTGTYKCKEWAFRKPVPDEVRKNAAGSAINPDQDATEFATQKVLIRKERMAASNLLAASGGFDTVEDAEGLWLAGASNTFLADMRKAINAIRKTCGKRPNILVLDGSTFDQIKAESTVLDLIKYGGGPNDPDKVTAQMIASLFDLDECLIGDGIYSSAAETKAGTDFTGANIWEANAGKGSAVVLYRPKVAGNFNMVPSAGWIFQWNQRIVYRYREQPLRRDVFECSEYFDIKVTGSDMGYVFTDTILT